MLTLLIFIPLCLISLMLLILAASLAACWCGRPDLGALILRESEPYFRWLRIGGR